MRKYVVCMTVLVLATSLGCQPVKIHPDEQTETVVAGGPRPGTPAGPPTASQPIDQSPANGAPAEALTPAEAAERVWRALELWGFEPDTTGAPTWAGIDRAGRLVLGAEPYWDILTHNRKFVPMMFRTNPQVERILVWTTEYYGTRPQRPEGSFSVIERATYETWPESEEVPFPMAEWGNRVDRHAERHGSLTGVQLEDVMALSDRWVRSIVGDRLAELRFVPLDTPDADFPKTVSLYITVDNPGASRQGRLVEAALLSGLPLLTWGVYPVEVSYPAAQDAKTIHLTEIGILNWYTYAQGDIEYLEGWLEVDGVVDTTKRPDGYLRSSPPYTIDDLTRLIQARPHLEALLPEGAELIVGRSRIGSGDGVAVIEATVPADWSPEQRWTVYGEVVDKLFAQNLNLAYIYLILYHGSEVEVIRVWKSHWSVRSFLTEASGEALEPLTLPLMAQWYDRYTIVDR